MGDIVITNAKVHNLRGIDVTIPRNSFIKILKLNMHVRSSDIFGIIHVNEVLA